MLLNIEIERETVIENISVCYDNFVITESYIYVYSGKYVNTYSLLTAKKFKITIKE